MAISDTAQEHLQEAMRALNELQGEHDARILAAACMSKAVFLYANLRRAGYETPESVTRIFEYGLNGALDDTATPQAKIQSEQGFIVDPSRKN